MDICSLRSIPGHFKVLGSPLADPGMPLWWRPPAGMVLIFPWPSQWDPGAQVQWAGLDWSFPSNPLIPLPWGNRILSKVHPAICPGEAFLAGDFCVPVTGSLVLFDDLSGAQMPWQRSQSPLGASRGPALEVRGLARSQA